MKSAKVRRSSPRNSISRSRGPLQLKEADRAQTFFGGSHYEPFFQPSRAFGHGDVVQPKCEECEKEEKQVQRVPENKEEDKMLQKADEEQEVISTPTYSEQGVVEQNTRHFANCDGVTVEGWTDANYGNSYTAPGSSTPASDCEGCSSDECVTNTGTVVSTFTANPLITLPSVPEGLNECERKAVQNFINTTLKAHEQQHVAAFNTYKGTVKTPYTYHGCASGLDAHTQQIHNNLETTRKAGSDAQSAALDAGGANIFSITCECPDPEPKK
jgi:hypothetical protein